MTALKGSSHSGSLPSMDVQTKQPMERQPANVVNVVEISIINALQCRDASKAITLLDVQMVSQKQYASVSGSRTVLARFIVIMRHAVLFHHTSLIGTKTIVARGLIVMVRCLTKKFFNYCADSCDHKKVEQNLGGTDNLAPLTGQTEADACSPVAWCQTTRSVTATTKPRDAVMPAGRSWFSSVELQLQAHQATTFY